MLTMATLAKPGDESRTQGTRCSRCGCRIAAGSSRSHRGGRFLCDRRDPGVPSVTAGEHLVPSRKANYRGHTVRRSDTARGASLIRGSRQLVNALSYQLSFHSIESWGRGERGRGERGVVVGAVCRSDPFTLRCESIFFIKLYFNAQVLHTSGPY